MMGSVKVLKKVTLIAVLIVALSLPVFAYGDDAPGGAASGKSQSSPTIEETPLGTETTPEAPAADETAKNGESSSTDTSTTTDTGADDTTIPEEEVPLSIRAYELGWSLVSFIATLLTVIIGVGLVVYSMIRRDSAKPGSDNFGLAVFSMAAAVISTVLFTSTADFQSSMIVADSFTVVHIAVLAVSILCAVLSLKDDVKALIQKPPSA
ncbi:MAG: hypothetical protein LBL27_04765 [Coriobacteriales bacterium]|jgi:hypothetical protein|nr:hypothetical protein [Coriobacteriales bacterium]